MFCTRCGREIPNNANTCEYCGNVVNRTNVNQGDAPSGILAVLSFFIPLVGLILFLVYHDSHPRKAKSAGKGAIAGFITSIVLSILAVVLYVFLIGTIIQKTTDYIYDEPTEIWEEILPDESDEILEQYLDVTLKNKAGKKCSYSVTLEAVDATGARLDTDMIFKRVEK